MISEDTFDSVFGDGMTEGFRQMEDVVRDVIDLIKAGENDEAILRLEREFWPKWYSVNESQRALFDAANDNTKEAAPFSTINEVAA